MKKENISEEYKKQIALKIIRGHLKLIIKYAAYCLERLERFERNVDLKND